MQVDVKLIVETVADLAGDHSIEMMKGENWMSIADAIRIALSGSSITTIEERPACIIAGKSCSLGYGAKHCIITKYNENAPMKALLCCKLAIDASAVQFDARPAKVGGPEPATRRPDCETEQPGERNDPVFPIPDERPLTDEQKKAMLEAREKAMSMVNTRTGGRVATDANGEALAGIGK